MVVSIVCFFFFLIRCLYFVDFHLLAVGLEYIPWHVFRKSIMPDQSVGDLSQALNMSILFEVSLQSL